MGLKLPQAELPQVTVQVTPAALLSSLTTAVRVVLVPITNEVGGFEIVTDITAAAVIVTVADADFEVSATEVAVMVTVFPVGTAAGAV